MHNSVKFAAAAIALLLCGCSGEAVRVEFAEKAYETGNSEVEAYVPHFECETKSEFAEEMSAEYDTMMMSLLDEFIAKTEQSTERSEFKLESEVKMNNGKLVSVVSEGEVYTGGAHGEKFRVSRTFDFAEGRTVTLEDIFADDGWRMAVDAKMDRLATSGEGEYKELWEKPSTSLLRPENFYISNDAIVLYFLPYELSYYRRGFVEFEFKFDELSGYLSEYIQNLINQ